MNEMEESTMAIVPESDSESTEKITQLNKAYQSTEADAFIRSSDGLLFKISSYRLMAASPVFQSMFDVTQTESGSKIHVCADKIITFTDDKIETAQVISTFLDIIYQGTIPEPVIVEQLRALEKVVSFMKKYDTVVPCHALRYIVHSWIRDSALCPFAFFRLACVLDDALLAKLAIRRTGGWFWSDKYKDKIGGNSTKDGDQCLTSASVMDPTALSLDTLQWIPSDYLFALLRASRIRQEKGNTDDDETWNAVANEFGLVMQKLRAKRT